MEPRIFHGDITTQYFASHLLSQFNRGNFRAQQVGGGNLVAVQIMTRERPTSGGETALTVNLQKVEDGVSVQIGKQAWLGVAASLGVTALTALRNPLAFFSRIDDLAQDIENLQLSEQVWDTIEAAAKAANASFELSERLRRLVCEYCLTANPIGEPSCIACGAPLGISQPQTCNNCGFVIKRAEVNCPNCGQKLD
ncbi:MAG TPA: zinc ribbon domain-containing protein [Anaerolineales bacterium]